MSSIRFFGFATNIRIMEIHFALLVTLLVAAFLLSSVPARAAVVIDQGNVLFSDDFEGYSLSSLPSSGACVNSVYTGGGDTFATGVPMTGCVSPPHNNAGLKMFPAYWGPASSGACTGGNTSVTMCQYKGAQCDGGCVCWDGNCQMGPNSFFAMVSETPCSSSGDGGTKCLKLGSSDWEYDKTEAAVDVNFSSIPVGSRISWTMKIWFSNSIQTNDITWWIFGSQLRYRPAAGGWAYAANRQNSNFILLGSYPIDPLSWHTVSIGVDPNSRTWDYLSIDGSQPFTSFSGTSDPGIGSNLGPTGVNYTNFGIAAIPLSNNQSVFDLGSANGWYMYLDDAQVAAYTGNPTTTTTTFITTSSSSSTTSTSSSTTSSPSQTASSSTTSSSGSGEGGGGGGGGGCTYLGGYCFSGLDCCSGLTCVKNSCVEISTTTTSTSQPTPSSTTASRQATSTSTLTISEKTSNSNGLSSTISSQVVPISIIVVACMLLLFFLVIRPVSFA